MAMMIGIIFTAMVLAFCLATGLISYSVYMCFKLHKSLQMKKLVKEKEELEKGKMEDHLPRLKRKSKVSKKLRCQKLVNLKSQRKT